MLRIEILKITLLSATLIFVLPEVARCQEWSQPNQPTTDFGQASWVKPVANNPWLDYSPSGGQAQQNGGQSGGEGGGGDLSADATNPTAAIKVFQLQNTFVPNTYEASGYAHVMGLQAVLPVKTRSEFFTPG